MARQMTAPPGETRAKSSDFADGVRAITPMVIAVVPFGIAIGAVAAAAHLNVMTGLSGSVLLLGGSAQLTLIQLLDGGSAAIVAILAALLINSRLLIYGAAVAPWFPTTSVRGRLLLAVPLIDQLYLTTTTEFHTVERDERGRRRFYAGAALHIWLAWIIAQTAGAVLGRGVPKWLDLEAASPIALAGLLAVAVTNRAAMLAAIAAGAVIAATSPLGLPYLIVVAMLVGIAVGWTSAPKPAEDAS
jgi:branched chain amino acid efflux pump